MGAVVLGISKDSVVAHKKFAEKFELPFVLLSDPKAEVMKKYHAFGKKMMYGKTVEGTIRSTLVIGPRATSSNTGLASKRLISTRARCWLFYRSERVRINLSYC